MSKNLNIAGSACVAVVLAAIVPAVRPVGAAEPRNSEQIVFSGGGTGTFGDPTPFGFWIWCQGDSTNPYTGFCHGAMYFYALGVVKAVRGAVLEPAEGSYQMIVASPDNQVSCMLQNVPPARRGPINVVTVTCSMPSGTGTSSSAVVNVTGPPEAD